MCTAIFFANVPVQGLIGDDSETTVLLHSLADRYQELGQAQTSVHLLRRAIVHGFNKAGSMAHLENMLQAALKLSEMLEEVGDVEAAVTAAEQVVHMPTPTSELSGAAPILNEIAKIQENAARHLQTLLNKHGRAS